MGTAPTPRPGSPLRSPATIQIGGKSLAETLELHKQWLATSGRSGKRADLTNQDLSLADLTGADLTKADLTGADLSEARLRGATLNYTVLKNANLSNADLEDLDSNQTTNVAGINLGGTDVTNAKLPATVKKFEGLKNVEEASKNSRKLFLVLMGAMVYCTLTIATTSDAKLISNQASASLPIIDASLPISWFFVVAPFLLLGGFVYLHLNFYKLWQLISELPARFPDGATLDAKIYPWLLNSIVIRHLSRLRSASRQPMARVTAGISIALAWWTTPGVVGMFWLFNLKAHDLLQTAIQIAAFGITTGSAALSTWLARRTLPGNEPNWRQGIMISLTVIAISLAAASWLSHQVISGDLAKETKFFAADVSDENLSRFPPGWDGKDLDWVEGAELEDRDLRHAIAHHAKLVKAKLEGAQLTGADLNWADLREAKLNSANLKDAQLFSTILQRADLFHADLTGAELTGADLHEAKLQQALLIGVTLVEANLRKAKLMKADLKDAILLRTDLRGSDLTDARNLTLDQLSLACKDKETTLPDGSHPPAELGCGKKESGPNL